ncbi:MAG: hypothetical protein JSV93_03570 [Candidatus Omnitrophota bacterium]|nr:MAG: hypothetical protein JSV93_03570 [Candidatus Omnitrophota bacterium]
MNIVGSIKNAFLLSQKLLKVVLIFFILNVIMGLISLPLTTPENAAKPAAAVISFFFTVIFFVIFIFLQGGALGLIRDIHKTGACSISNFSAYGKKYYLKILGLLSIYILIALGIALVLFLLGSGVLLIANNAFVRALVTVMAVAVALVAVVMLLFPVYSIVVDESSILEAIKKGINISRNNFWEVLKIFLSLIAISVVVSLVIGFIIGIITIPLPLILTRVIITIVNSAVQSYIPIIMMLVLMGYYLGLAKEGKSPHSPAV